MKKVNTSLFIIFFSIQISHAQVVINKGDELCTTLNNELMTSGNVICLVKSDPTANGFYNLTLNCDITLGQGQELKIPARTRINLIDGATINLNGNAKITGEHFQTSEIIIGDSGNVPPEDYPAINMESCVGCEVTELTIKSDNQDDNTIGLEIDENSSENEVSAVKFQDINNGMVVKGDMNTFNDLQFIRVGITGDMNCDPADNDIMAVKMITSNSNSFINLLHLTSPGAVTIKMDGICNNNTILNITVEQERSHCENNLENDPALYIINENSTGNLITCNFNHARTVINNNNEVLICNNNNISSLANCNRSSASLDCSN